MTDTAALEALRARFQAEIDNRLKIADPDEAHALVCCAREVKRLSAIASDPNQPAETQLEAASRTLDLMGLSAKTAQFRDVSPTELTLPELHNVLARIDIELEVCSEAA
jgi:hypothetical protein